MTALRTTQLRAVRRTTQSRVALGFGVLAVFTAVAMYWLVLPGLLFGVAAVVLGRRLRREAGSEGGSEAGSAALALGIVALLLVPAVLVVVADAESWGRDCALHPSQSDC